MVVWDLAAARCILPLPCLEREKVDSSILSRTISKSLCYRHDSCCLQPFRNPALACICCNLCAKSCACARPSGVSLSSNEWSIRDYVTWQATGAYGPSVMPCQHPVKLPSLSPLVNCQGYCERKQKCSFIVLTVSPERRAWKNGVPFLIRCMHPNTYDLLWHQHLCQCDLKGTVYLFPIGIGHLFSSMESAM